MIGRVGTGLHVGDVGEIDRPALEKAHDQAGDVLGARQERARLHRHLDVVGDQRARLGHGVTCRQREAQVVDRHAEAGDPLRVELDVHDALRAADRVDVARALDALEFGLERVRNHEQVVGPAFLVLCPQRRGHDRNVVDPLGLDERRHDAEARRPPVLVGVNSVVEAHQGLGPRLTDLELHGEYADARPRDRVHVLHAIDLCQHLLHRDRHEVLDLGR